MFEMNKKLFVQNEQTNFRPKQKKKKVKSKEQKFLFQSFNQWIEKKKIPMKPYVYQIFSTWFEVFKMKFKK